MIRHRRAFSLIELLVLTAIIAVLIALLLPTVNTVRQQAISMKCMAQMHEMGNALAMYSNDNHGWLASSDTAGPLYPQNFNDPEGKKIFPVVNAAQTWVGWVDGGPSVAALQNGTLWKYLRTASIYRCPADVNEFRNRSYSMNAYLCSGSPTGSGLYFNVLKLTQIRNSTQAIAFAEDCDPQAATGSGSQSSLSSQWNINGWVQFPMAADAYPALAPTQDLWCGLIATWHRSGANFTFIDGHAEYWHFTDARTLNYLHNDPTWPNPYYKTPHNVDLDRIRRGIATWSILRAPPATTTNR